MGNQKFKLSDMIPNAWFHKLKETNNTTKPSKLQSTKLKRGHLQTPLPPPPPLPSPSSSIQRTNNNPPKFSKFEPQFQSRKSYHITRELINPPQELHFSPPRKSKSSSKSKKSSRRTSSYSSCSCKSTTTTTFPSSRSKSNSNSPSSPPLFEDALLKTEHKTEDFDFVIDVDKDSFFNDINTFKFKLKPIITKNGAKPTNFSKENSKEDKIVTPNLKEQRSSYSPSLKKFSERGVKLKMNSPRILGMKQGQNGNSGRRSTSSKKRRSISESFAVVKSSFDPQKDFKESMVEMIVQNNLRGSKDLEDLLACYLSLNSDEYHDVIIKVFKQIWFDLRHEK